MAKTFSIKLDTSKLDALTKGVPDKADKIVGKMAFQVQADAVASFGTGPAGRTYKRGGIEHVASAPPGPPAIDTGALRASVHTTKIRDSVWQVGDGVEYGAYQEFGTPFIAPRPWLYPAVFKMQQIFTAQFGELFV